ncbi:hypothetical protein V5E97_18165 [Singulisphaera sp. Ch08]|uniref:Uncharacterized protein n=1 Tax=Singulisphaera sp. Ch08 TaxID=3120278 RepID=A0AAU7CSE8_9BACT
MRKPGKRALTIGLLVVAALVAVPVVIWVSLTHQPDFYRAIVQVPRERQEAEARRFVTQSLQLRNDIINEPTWEAIFTDQEVNAWLAKDLVTEFADQLPPEVHEPRIVFGVDRITLAFELDQGPVRSVIWVVARPQIPEPNVLELTFEKIRAGVLPVPAEQVIDRIVNHARAQGLDVRRELADGLPVVIVRYTPHSERDDVLLEQVQIREGEIRLAGRSNRAKGQVDAPSLPTRKVLQSRFPKRKNQEKGSAATPVSTLKSTASPST